MKKILSVLLVVFMLCGTAAFASSSSLVGQKVQSEVLVTLNGKPLGNAVLINNTAYAPLRLIAEASGLGVGYTKGEVPLVSEVETVKTPEDLTKEKRQLAARAEFLNSAIADAEYSLGKYRKALVQVDETVVDFYVDLITQGDREYVEYANELAEVNERIAEIEKLLK